LGNLFKTQIYELATYLDIPQEIVSKPPSAGLWAGQTDEVELGLTYTELDQYLAVGEAGKELRQKIDSMINENSHKRSISAVPDF
jgi:NAD+ synthase